MATDPVRTIQEREYELSITVNPERYLAAIAELAPAGTVPYITVTVDWQPAGDDPARNPVRTTDDTSRSHHDEQRDREQSNRPGRQVIEKELSVQLGELDTDRDTAQVLEETKDRIMAWLDSEIEPSTRGAIIVAGGDNNVFGTVELGISVPTEVHIGRQSALMALARIVDDYPTYAVLVADQQDATLSFITQNRASSSVSLRGNDYPRKQSQGGYSQRRFQARADERIDAFASAIAEETRRALNEAGVDHLVLGGDDVILSALDDQFHESVKECVIGTVALPIVAGEAEIVEATLPLNVEREREEEQEDVRRLVGEVGANHLGAAGAADTLRALQAGQVQVLVMNDDFHADGWADYQLGMFGVGNVPTSHPGGGDVANLVPIDLENELIRLTLDSGGEIQIVKTAPLVSADEQEGVRDADDPMPRAEPAKQLDEFGGVGALLRFSLGQADAEEAQSPS